MPKIKAVFYRLAGSVVVFQIEEMSEAMRDSIKITDHKGITVRSNARPYINLYTVYLRGTERSQDLAVCSMRFRNDTERDNWINNAESAIREHARHFTQELNNHKVVVEV